MVLKIFGRHSSVDFNQDGSDRLKTRAAVTQIIFSVLANLTVLSPGMGLSFPAITSEILLKDGPAKFTASQVSWFASITPFLCPFGGPLQPIFVNKFGRKGTLIIINVLCVIQWIITALSSENDSQTLFIQLIVARVLAGLAVGMITAPAMLYSAEISHVKIRSRLVVLSVPFFMSFGILLIYILSYITGDDFRLASIYALGITIFALLLCLCIPESPVYLINRNKVEHARKVLAILGSVDEKSPKIQQQIEQIQQANQNAAGSSKVKLSEEIRKPEFYKPFLIMTTFFGIQQFSGIFTIYILTARFSMEAGVNMDAFLSTVIIGVIRVVLQFITSFVMNQIGRRELTMFSSAGMFLSMIGLVACKIFNSQENLSWLNTLFAFSFCVFGTPGILTLPFTMISEVFPMRSKSIGIGLTVSLAFIMVFATAKTFVICFEYFGSIAMFSFYALISALGIIFSYFILPETRNKTPQDLEEYFKK